MKAPKKHVYRSGEVRFRNRPWALLKQDKIDLACEGRTMVITFK